MMRLYILILLCCFWLVSDANNLSITNVAVAGSDLTFDISWDNSWRNGLTFHDAVWIFVKQAPNGGPSWTHANISAVSAGPGFEAFLPADHVGVFVRRSVNGIGTSSTSMTLTIENPVGAFQDYKVMGVEMVYVPQGAFWAGDGVSGGRIHPGNNDTMSYQITGEGALNCGAGATDIGFSSGSCEDLVAAFPKGYDAFYSMKYSITQGQYVDFLNCLPREAQENNVQADITGTTVTNYYVMVDAAFPIKGNVIRCDDTIGTGNITFYCDRDNDGVGNEDSDGMFRAMNYLCASAWLAYLDWSGLRPMSFLEFEKACRGPLPAVPNEKSWGSTLVNGAGAVINPGTDVEAYANSGTDGGISTYTKDAIRVGFNAPASGATRELSNASYYGILDLGNNPADYYVHYSFGGTFAGSNGDGTLSLTGYADVSDWPAGSCGSFRIRLMISSGGVSTNSLSTSIAGEFAAGRGVRSL